MLLLPKGPQFGNMLLENDNFYYVCLTFHTVCLNFHTVCLTFHTGLVNPYKVNFLFLVCLPVTELLQM